MNLNPKNLKQSTGPILSGNLAGLTTPSVINQRLAAAIDECGPIHLSDITIRPELFHLTSFSGGKKIPLHIHPFFELTFIHSGKIQYQTETTRIFLKKGDIFFMPPGIPHQWKMARQETSLYSFMLSVDPSGKADTQFAAELSNIGARLNYHLPSTIRLQKAFLAVVEEISANRPYLQEIVAAYVRLILGLVLRHIRQKFDGVSTTKKTPSNHKAHVVQHAKAFIQAHLSFGIGANEVASHIGITPRHLNRIFQTALGLSTGNFIQQVRLENAKHLLRHHDGMIKQIAILCGFKDCSYFCRFFRQQTGQSPHRYQESGRVKTSR